MTFHKSRIAVVVVFAAISACNSTTNARELAGLYVMNKGDAADSLVLRADSSYRRIYAKPNAPVVVDTGHWSAVNRNGTQRLEFSNFLSRWRGEMFPTDNPSTPGWFVVVPTVRFLGGVRLDVDPDLGWAYVRQRSP